MNAHLLQPTLRVLLTGALLLLVTSVAPAQRAWDIVPFAGVGVPLSAVAEGEGLELKHGLGPAFGVRLGVPSGDRLAWEGVLALASSAVEASGMGSTIESRARRFLLSARARYLISGGSGNRTFLSGGLALISHGGDAYEDVDGTTDIGAVIGVGMELPISERHRLRIDLEDYIYSASFGVGSASTDGRLQNDLMLSVGFVIGWRR